MDSNNCPHCGAEIRNSVLKSNQLLPNEQIKAVNDILGLNKDAYCHKCYPELKFRMDQIKKEADEFINGYVYLVPILTTHTPFGWNYSSLGIVTGQSVTGTGVISEFTSGFSDFFGQQSGSFTRKIASGEQLCLSQLRIKALKLGGHAVIATDIDYGELGSVKGMIMVCAAGTAVRLNDLSVLDNKQKVIADLQEKVKILDMFAKHSIYM